MNLFGIGPTEIAVVLIVILVLFGPDKLPELAKKIGGMSRELRDGLNTINEQMNTALETSMEMEKAQMLKPTADTPAPTETPTIAPPAAISQSEAASETSAVISQSETAPETSAAISQSETAPETSAALTQSADANPPAP
ncbi:hypothetical protein FBQ82_14845 [Anaerolineae bacterium CFX7]|nr:hypothetical protein [Anaerolineae bacterium CFX7]